MTSHPLHADYQRLLDAGTKSPPRPADHCPPDCGGSPGDVEARGGLRPNPATFAQHRAGVAPLNSGALFAYVRHDAHDRFAGEHPSNPWPPARAAQAPETGYAPAKYLRSNGRTRPYWKDGTPSRKYPDASRSTCCRTFNAANSGSRRSSTSSRQLRVSDCRVRPLPRMRTRRPTPKRWRSGTAMGTPLTPLSLEGFELRPLGPEARDGRWRPAATRRMGCYWRVNTAVVVEPVPTMARTERTRRLMLSGAFQARRTRGSYLVSSGRARTQGGGPDATLTNFVTSGAFGCRVPAPGIHREDAMRWASSRARLRVEWPRRASPSWRGWCACCRR
jgi:hypothetical protein